MPEISLKYKKSDIKKVKVTTAVDLFEVLKEMYDRDTVEYNESSIVIFLDSANKTIGWTRHTSGGMAHTIVDPKMILAEALLCGAMSVVFSHNHPSCQLSASREDEKITQRLKYGCEVIGIRLLDHIIVAGDFSGYYSFLEEGKI